MRPDDADILWVEEPTLGVLEKMYLPAILEGLVVTARRMFEKKVTVEYPEQRLAPADPLKYRGVHRLNKDEQDRVKCVACFLCETACPAECIHIVGDESPWPDREKYPTVFSIDELRCIYCGLCEEACPVDAIELTGISDLTGQSRQEMIYDKEKLLSIYDETQDSEPMRTQGRPPLSRGLPSLGGDH